MVSVYNNGHTWHINDILGLKFGSCEIPNSIMSDFTLKPTYLLLLLGKDNTANYSHWDTKVNAPAVSVNPQGDHGQPRRFWHWCSDPGAVLIFKIKKFPLPGVEIEGILTQKVQMRVGSLTEVMFKCQNPPSLPAGGTLWFTLTDG